MRQALVPMALIVVLLASCTNSSAGPDLSQAKPGQPVTLSENVPGNIIPLAVIPYGREPAFALSALELTHKGSSVIGKMDFTRNQQEDFTLVVYLSMSDRMLVAYFDAEKHLLVLPATGDVLFGLSGYTLSGDKTGTIKFSLADQTYSVYSLQGKRGTAYVFCVPGKVNPRSALPGDQADIKTFQANSNVLTQEFSF